MKKLTKLIMPLVMASAAIAPTIALTSCNNKQETQETWAEYIYDRTFSVLGSSDIGGGYASVCWGTCWILSDATPTITNDYVYNIVTNWHVIKGIDEAHARGTDARTWFGCNTKSSGLDLSRDFIEFKSFNKYAESKFTYDNVETITTTEYDEEGQAITKTGKKGCDIFVAKADFSSFATSTSPSASIAKSKLDKLNKLTAAGSKITQLADTTTEGTHFESKKMYTGGYPVKNDEYATWEKHDLSTEGIVLKYNTGTQQSQLQNETHWSDTSNTPLTDCTPQYIGNNVGTTWMLGGSSGSMLIANFGTDTNPEFKVCGIYWGGSGNDTTFFPYFSIFNSSWKNYLAEWA